jgi:hypothetical protein
MGIPAGGPPPPGGPLPPPGGPPNGPPLGPCPPCGHPNGILGDAMSFTSYRGIRLIWSYAQYRATLSGFIGISICPVCGLIVPAGSPWSLYDS